MLSLAALRISDASGVRRPSRTHRPRSLAHLIFVSLALPSISLALGACDPPSAGRSTHDLLLPRSGQGQEAEHRDPVADAALGEAKLVVLADGTLDLYDRHGRLRARVLDPSTRFPDVLELSKVPMGRAKPHPEISVRLAGLSDRLTHRERARKEQEALEAKGLGESARVLAALAEAAETTERRLAELDGELAALWTDTSKPASERRRLLFVRWDECEEGDGSTEPLRLTTAVEAPDALRGQAGDRARATIEAFVRKHVPTGSGDAFGAEELAAFNGRRKSTRRFDPYGPSARPGPGQG
jgi:hypothetical protein